MFKRKPKNRVHEREKLLEVKMRSEHVRSARLRMATMVFAGLIGVAVVLITALHGSDWLLQELVYRNRSFTVRKLEIRTDGIIPLAQIREWAGIKDGDNLLKLDLLRIKRDLELSPLIQSAMVERVLPGTLRIQVIEREPVARVAGYQTDPANGRLKPALFFLDEAGYVMLPLVSRYSPIAGFPSSEMLPLLFGVPMVELRPGWRAESQQIHSALKLIMSFGRADIAAHVDIKSIELSTPSLLEVTTWQGNRVTFGPDRLPLQLSRWRLVQNYATQQQLAIGELDLSVSNNVPAKWLEISATPPRKLPKPPPYKKRHA